MSSKTLYTAFIEIGYKGFDKVDKHMKDAISSVRRGMDDVNHIFNMGSSAMLSFTQAANPAAINTFNGSMELLKAQIGKEFTPYILIASKGLQDLQRWVKALDPETRKQIASWVAYGTAAAGIIVVIRSVDGAFRALAGNPIALALLAAGAAALKAKLEMDGMAKSMNRVIEQSERMKKGIFTEKEYKGSVAHAIESDEGLSKEQKVSKAKQMIEKLRAEGLQITGNNKNDTFMKQAQTTAIKTSSWMFGTEDTVGKDAKKVEGITKEIGLLEGTLKKLESGKPVDFASEESVRKPKQKMMLGGMGGMLGSSAGVGGLDGAYGNLNRLALGQNDTQRETMKIQQESLKEMRDMAGDMEDVVEMFRRATGL